MRIPFGTQSYQHTSLPLSAQRMVNCYLEPAPPQAKTLAAVVASFGVDTETTVGAGPYRGALLARSTLYVLSGTELYRVDRTFTATLLGSVPGAAFCFLAGDETNVLVVDPGTHAGYYWNGSIVQRVTDPDWPGASWLGYLDGYFVIIQPGTGKFYITAYRNPASIDALDFASAERYPDDLVTGIVDHGELILFGTESGEVFYDSGDATFPLSKVSSGDFEIGCTAPRGPAKIDNTVFFPGSDGKVYRLNGYTPIAISTPVVEQAIERATDRDFVGFAWKEPGHAFYGLKGDGFAFIYDISTQLWYEKESYGLNAWRWEFILRAYDKWIVGDATSNKLGALSAETFTEFGSTLRASCTSPPVGEENRRTIHSRVELVFEQGVGIVTGQGADPQVMLQFSDDGGRTWSSEKWRSMGLIGQFRRRSIWNRLGQARDRIYRYAISDPVRRTLILATTEAKVGAY